MIRKEVLYWVIFNASLLGFTLVTYLKAPKSDLYYFSMAALSASSIGLLIFKYKDKYLK